MSLIDFTSLFTNREMYFEPRTQRGDSLEHGNIRVSVPLKRFEDRSLFKTFIPQRPARWRPVEFSADHIAGFNPTRPVMVNRSILDTSLTGFWTVEKTSSFRIYLENDDDAMLFDLAGVFTGLSYRNIERDADREARLIHRGIYLTVSERRRIISLLRSAQRQGEKLPSYVKRILDQNLLEKIT